MNALAKSISVLTKEVSMMGVSRAKDLHHVNTG
jgi:hypothetical protein